jgi:hypothetical protein
LLAGSFLGNKPGQKLVFRAIATFGAAKFYRAKIRFKITRFDFFVVFANFE